MLAREFYALTISEESAVAWLQAQGVFQDPAVPPPCTRHGCDGDTQLITRRKRKRDGTIATYPAYRCKKRGCRSTQSVRRANQFFTYFDIRGRAHCNLSICAILELVYFWCNDLSHVDARRLTGRSKQAILDWYNICRQVPLHLWERRTKMGGVGAVVHMDEALLLGQRKTHKGRPNQGDVDVTKNGTRETYGDSEMTSNDHNYEGRVEGPWVFGLAHKRSDGLIERRFFVVQCRDKATLHNIITTEVETGSILHSDDWSAYDGIQAHGYHHRMVNHSTKLLSDPDSGVGTPLIERLWGDLKLKILRKMHGKSPELVPRYLVEVWWRGLHPCPGRFEAYISSLKDNFL